MFGEDPAVAAAAHAPSGDALDRASRMVYDHAPSLPPKTDGSGEFVPQYLPLIEEIAKLIDRADAAADTALIGGHTVVHWNNTAERRARQIAELDAIVRRRNVRIGDLEKALEEQVDTIAKRNASIAELEAAADIAARHLEIADRQRREFLGHSRTANARREEAERERDDARRRVAELESAGWGEVAEQSKARVHAAERRVRDLQRDAHHARAFPLSSLTSGELLAEIGRRVGD